MQCSIACACVQCSSAGFQVQVRHQRRCMGWWWQCWWTCGVLGHQLRWGKSPARTSFWAFCRLCSPSEPLLSSSELYSLSRLRFLSFFGFFSLWLFLSLPMVTGQPWLRVLPPVGQAGCSGQTASFCVSHTQTAGRRPVSSTLLWYTLHPQLPPSQPQRSCIKRSDGSRRCQFRSATVPRTWPRPTIDM